MSLSSGAPASPLTGAWCCPHDPSHHLACPAPVNLREAETGDSVASLTACAGNSGVCGTAAELPSQFRDRPHHAGLGRPGTSPPTPARIEGQKAALPATLPQSHRHATKQRDSTKAGPQARPCPRHVIAAAWELEENLLRYQAYVYSRLECMCSGPRLASRPVRSAMVALNVAR